VDWPEDAAIPASFLFLETVIGRDLVFTATR
jgi:hypothetical protein